jgi:hypothetical protein
MPDLSPEGGEPAPDRALLKPPRRICTGLAVAAFLLAAVAAVVLLMPSGTVLGATNTDLIQQFLAWRAFAAQTLLAGHLPLWNPYTYSGEPFLGGFQSALLYPPNVVFLVLPLGRAVNFSVLLHLAILGWGMHRIASRRGLHPLAAAVCAGLLPLSGVVFPHVYAGHLPNLCSMAWAPWILSGLEDHLHGRGSGRGLLLASAAAGLQILAGHVQYVFYTAVAAGLYALACSFTEPSVRRRALPGVAVLYLGAAALSAAQLFPGLDSIREGIRHSRLDLGFASMFSLPVENLLTFVTPGFFGDLNHHVYWGRGFLWEMTVFAGASGLVLAGAAVLDPVWRRLSRVDLAMTAVLLLLAVGSHTPLFAVLYEHVPGFDRFRGTSKFTFPALLFLVLAIGGGADALIRGRVPRPVLSTCALQSGFAAGIAGLALRVHPELLSGVLNLVQGSGESYLPAPTFSNRAFIQTTGFHAGTALIGTAAVLLLSGITLRWARRRPLLRWVTLGLLPLEMAAFAHAHFATAGTASVLPKGLRTYVDAHPGDYRVLNLKGVNNGFLLGKPDIWGDDPGPLRRYAEFIAYSQREDPDQVTQIGLFHYFPGVYEMLRLRYAFVPDPNGTKIGEQVRKPMDEVQLISDYRVLPGRDAIFPALMAPSFNPRKTVLLESLPDPRPVPSAAPGTVRVLEAVPDALRIEADVASPALLLITDLYSRNWRARGVGNAVQKVYEILPANYVLRAIPLAAGHHEIVVEYVPGGFRLGLAVSALAWLAWAFLAWRPDRALRKPGP